MAEELDWPTIYLWGKKDGQETILSKLNLTLKLSMTVSSKILSPGGMEKHAQP